MIESKKSKYAIGIVSCNREGNLIRIIESLSEICPDIPVVVSIDKSDPLYSDDTLTFLEQSDNVKNVYISLESKGVAHTKNKAIEQCVTFLDDDDFVFIIEDDCLPLSKTLFNVFVNFLSKTGYGLSAINNFDSINNSLLATVLYEDNAVYFWRSNQGAFTCYNVGAIKDVGLFDDTFFNALEHSEHYYRFVKKGYAPDFWWNPSPNLVGNLYENIDNGSTITHNPDRSKWIAKGAQHWKQKHGVFISNIENKGRDFVINDLKQRIKEK